MNTVSRSADLLAGRALVVRRLIPAESAVEEEMRRRRNELVRERLSVLHRHPVAPALLGERDRRRRRVRAVRFRSGNDARAIRQGAGPDLRRAPRPRLARGARPPPSLPAGPRPRGRQAGELLRRRAPGRGRRVAPRQPHRFRHRLHRRRAALPVPALEHARRDASLHAAGELRPGDSGGPGGVPADGPDEGRLRPRHHPRPHRERPLPGGLLHEHDVARAEEGAPRGDAGGSSGDAAGGPAEPRSLDVPRPPGGNALRSRSSSGRSRRSAVPRRRRRGPVSSRRRVSKPWWRRLPVRRRSSSGRTGSSTPRSLSGLRATARLARSRSCTTRSAAASSGSRSSSVRRPRRPPSTSRGASFSEISTRSASGTPSSSPGASATS